MRVSTFTIALALTSLALPALGQPTTNPALWARMQRINARSANVVDLSADFRQEKFTAMLEQPLVSHGTVRLRGPVMLWKTTDPEPTVMRIDPTAIQIYYPKQKTLEVYNVDQKLMSLAASPLPKLEALKKYFTFSRIPLARMDQSDDNKYLALQMLPIGQLREQVQQVRVLLETKTGLVVRMEITDADQDRTVLTFSQIRTNTALSARDVELHVPPGVRVSHPLAGLEQNAEGK